jgi:hypothetical protein
MDDRERIEAFRDYIEDSVLSDDRYGAASRHDTEPKSLFATRFEVAPECWLAVEVLADQARVAVAFLTSDHSRAELVEQAIAEAGGDASRYLGEAFQEAGMDWPDPPVAVAPQDGLYGYVTLVQLDELRDLDNDSIRDKTLRMLEGFMMAFAPALLVEEEAD